MALDDERSESRRSPAAGSIAERVKRTHDRTTSGKEYEIYFTEGSSMARIAKVSSMHLARMIAQGWKLQRPEHEVRIMEVWTITNVTTTEVEF